MLYPMQIDTIDYAFVQGVISIQMHYYSTSSCWVSFCVCLNYHVYCTTHLQHFPLPIASRYVSLLLSFIHSNKRENVNARIHYTHIKTWEKCQLLKYLWHTDVLSNAIFINCMVVIVTVRITTQYLTRSR